MKIMGIDPGIGRVGWGLIEEEKGKLKCLSFDCFETSKNEKLEERLLQINKFLSKLLIENKPDLVAIEDLFFAANSKTAIVVGQARGAIVMTVGQAGLPIASYTPLQIKQALTDKKQIQYMVKNLLKLETLPKQDDAADALAIAITHAVSYKLKERIKNK
jgi:crossover junction endodeoxyribonuclease RuvC